MSQPGSKSKRSFCQCFTAPAGTKSLWVFQACLSSARDCPLNSQVRDATDLAPKLMFCSEKWFSGLGLEDAFGVSNLVKEPHLCTGFSLVLLNHVGWRPGGMWAGNTEGYSCWLRYLEWKAQDCFFLFVFFGLVCSALVCLCLSRSVLELIVKKWLY